MKLVKPSYKYAKNWKKAIAEFAAEGVGGFWNKPHKPTTISEYIGRTRNHARGIEIPKDWVQATTFWLVDNGRFIGHVNIRHRLNRILKIRGGHIGYAIRSCERERGYGTAILKLAIEKAREIGLKKVLMTIHESNIASEKIILKNGGKYLKTIVSDQGRRVKHFQIEL